MNTIEQNIDKIEEICHEYKVNKLFAFGSVYSENFNKKSDLDFIVEFQDISLEKYADYYFGLLFSLEKIFNKHVDLILEKDITNKYFIKKVSESKHLIYER